MANDKKKPFDLSALTKRQASAINRDNRNLSANTNEIIDSLHSMTYGVQRTDKIDSIMDQFDHLLNDEISSINKRADGDVTSFITKLFSDNNKKLTSALNSIDELFDLNEGQIESFLTEQYKNRMIKQADLHEVASQLIELKEAINITRDAIVSPDIVSGHMSRTIKFDSYDGQRNDYLPIIENMEEKFRLQEKIKDFMIPRSLEYGEYYVYCVPYSKIFEDFAKEKDSKIKMYQAYRENTESEFTLADFVKKKKSGDSLLKVFTEAVDERTMELYKVDKTNKKEKVTEEMNAYLENISVNNSPIPLALLEEGIESYREYYNEFYESKMYTETPSSDSFNKVMKNVDAGVFNDGKKTKQDKFDNVHDCYIKLMDPMHLLPIDIMDETIGYYYIQEDEINPLAGILTSTMYYDRYDAFTNKSTVLDAIADTIVASFDKKFLEKNMKFKKLIVEALNYYKLNTRRIKFQFIPKEYVVSIKVNQDENGHGTSIIEPSLFYAKLYLMILLFKIMSIILNSNDTKVNYLKQSGIDLDIKNKIDNIVRQKQIRQINLADMFSYTTLINKIGSGSEMYVPVGRTGERGIETEILSGQDVQINSELMEMLKKAYISGTGVPDVLMNYLNEADFAKTLELANNRFRARVVSYQLDYNRSITEMYRLIAKYSTALPDDVVDSLEFNFIQPEYHDDQVTNDMINNLNALLDFLVFTYFGQNATDDPANLPKIQRFRKEIVQKRFSMLNFDELDELFKKSQIEGTSDNLAPKNTGDENI